MVIAAITIHLARDSWYTQSTRTLPSVHSTRSVGAGCLRKFLMWNVFLLENQRSHWECCLSEDQNFPLQKAVYFIFLSLPTSYNYRENCHCKLDTNTVRLVNRIRTICRCEPESLGRLSNSGHKLKMFTNKYIIYNYFQGTFFRNQNNS